ncbi:MAG TPA: GNAT family N-acetyltransferase [Oryzihumus sp.]|nr:GNAT family N-acetyltransferase [Oryzihumus sp.]
MPAAPMPAGGVTIRPALAADIPALAAIYGHAVRTSVATFDVEDPEPAYWLAKVESTHPGDHVLVAQDGEGCVIGYAYSGSFRPRPAYDRTRETSVYLAPEAVGRGVGTTLYTRLLELMRAAGVHLAVAVVAQPNPASDALHRSLGFREVGTLEEVGHKFGAYVSTRWYQLLLEPPGAEEPAEERGVEPGEGPA